VKKRVVASGTRRCADVAVRAVVMTVAVAVEMNQGVMIESTVTRIDTDGMRRGNEETVAIGEGARE
jgi:hypothetical protein